MCIDGGICRLPLWIARICPSGVSAHWRGILCCGWYRLLIGTRESKTERRDNVVCRSVVLEAKRCMRIKMG